MRETTGSWRDRGNRCCRRARRRRPELGRPDSGARCDKPNRDATFLSLPNAPHGPQWCFLYMYSTTHPMTAALMYVTARKYAATSTEYLIDACSITIP